MKSTDLFPGFSFIPEVISEFHTPKFDSESGQFLSLYRLVPEGEDQSGCRIKTLSLKLEELHHPGKERISGISRLAIRHGESCSNDNVIFRGKCSVNNKKEAPPSPCTMKGVGFIFEISLSPDAKTDGFSISGEVHSISGALPNGLDSQLGRPIAFHLVGIDELASEIPDDVPVSDDT